MLVLPATTPYEARDAIVAFIQSEIERHKTMSTYTVSDRKANRIRETILVSLSLWLKDCAFHDAQGKLIIQEPTP